MTDIINQTTINFLTHSANKTQILASKPHKRAWVHLRYGLEQGTGVVMLSGPTGMGKTSLLNILVQETQHANVEVIELSWVDIYENGFLQELFNNIERPLTYLENTNQSEYFEIIYQLISTFNKKIIVFIDDAENLSSNDLLAINRLINHDLTKQKVQVMLCGNNDLPLMMSLKEFSTLRQSIVVSYELLPLSEKNAHQYLENQFKFTKIASTLLPSKDQLQLIVENAEGIPSQINQGLVEFFKDLETIDHQKNQLLAFDRLSNANTQSVNNFVSADISNKNIIQEPIPTKKSWFNKETIATGLVSYALSILVAIGIVAFVNSSFTESNSNDSTLLVQQTNKELNSFATEKQKTTLVEPKLDISNLPTIEKQQTKDIKKTENIAKTQINIEPNIAETVTSKPKLKSAPEEHRKSVALGAIITPIGSETKIIEIPAEESLPDDQIAESGSLDNEIIAANESDQQPMLDLEVKPIIFTKPKFDSLDLNALISRFEVAYKFGDLKQINQLLSSNVKSNNIDGKKAFIEEYKMFFNITVSRSIHIFDIDWEESNNSAIGQGSFKVSLNERGSTSKGIYKGTIVIRIEKLGEKLKISEILYNYENI